MNIFIYTDYLLYSWWIYCYKRKFSLYPSTFKMREISIIQKEDSNNLPSCLLISTHYFLFAHRSQIMKVLCLHCSQIFTPPHALQPYTEIFLPFLQLANYNFKFPHSQTYTTPLNTL